LKSFLKNIDVRRFTGVNRILGVDLNEHRFRVVELERHGSPFNKFQSNFKVTNSFSLEFEVNDPAQKRVDVLKKVIQEKRVTTKYAVSSIQSIGVKSLITTLPFNTQNIDEWIRDHCERLLKIPVSPRDVSFGYEVLSKDDSTISIEITFIRNSDINECKFFFKNAGLELIALGAGVRDAQNVLVEKNYFSSSGKFSFVYCQEGKAFLTTFENGRVLSRQTAALEPGELSNVVPNEEISSIIGDGGVMLAGESSFEGKSIEDLLQPFGLQSEYTLAAGLALKGFMPELSPVNFLDKTEQAHTEEKIYASLFQRVVLVCGAFTIFLLLAQSLVSAFLQRKIENLDIEILAMGPAYTEVAALERRVSDLRKETGGGRAFSRRSNISRSLHEIAAATPSGIWLNRLELNRDENLKYNLLITGSSQESNLIAEYLKSLEANHLCTDVVLLRSGSAQEPGTQVSVTKISSSRITFDIKAVLNE
jgi:hypothetical protein